MGELAFAPNSNDPVEVPPSPEALDAFKGFYDAHARRQIEAPTEALEAAFAKLEAAAARLALILALAREPKAQEVDFASMAAGILLAEWFAHEAERVYGMAGKSTQRR